MSESGYIQGAGDDNEGWSCGLTPVTFWRYKEQLLEAAEEDIADKILHLTELDAKSFKDERDAVQVGSTNLYLGAVPESAQMSSYEGIVVLGNKPPPTRNSMDEAEQSKGYLYLVCGGDGKVGSRALRFHLPRIATFIASLSDCGKPPRVLFASPIDKDLSVGALLAMFCLFFDSECKLLPKKCLLAFYLQICYHFQS